MPIKTLDVAWWRYQTSSVFIVNFEQISHFTLAFLLKHWRKLKSHWLRAFLAITWEPDFSWPCSFHRMLKDHQYYHFTSFPDKTNHWIFLKSQKTAFQDHFWSFLPMEIFPEKIQLCHTRPNMGLIYRAKIQKKLMS